MADVRYDQAFGHLFDIRERHGGIESVFRVSSIPQRIGQLSQRRESAAASRVFEPVADLAAVQSFVDGSLQS